MTPDQLKALLARGLSRIEADSVVESVHDLSRDELYDLCHAAGVETIRPHDSRWSIVRRLHLALTARVRLDERLEC